MTSGATQIEFPAYQVEVVEEAGMLPQLSAEWDRLLERSGADRMFLSPDWMSAWWHHLRGTRRLHLLAVRSGGQLIALAPFATRRLPGGLEILEFLASDDVGSDYLDVIVQRGEEANVAAVLAHELVSKGHPLRLWRVPAEDCMARRIVRELSSRGWTVNEQERENCPVEPIAGPDFDEFLGRLSSEHRYGFRRKLKRLEKQHVLHFGTARNESERHAAFTALVRLHRARWGSASQAFSTDSAIAFHDEATRLALVRGSLRLHLLSLDGKPVAAVYALAENGRWGFYNAGFDLEYARLGVGVVAMGLAIREAVREGLKEIDLLHGEENYKHHWTRNKRQVARLVVHPPGVVGVASRAAFALDRVLMRSFA